MQKVKLGLFTFGLMVVLVGLSFGAQKVSADYCATDWSCICTGNQDPATGYCDNWTCTCPGSGDCNCHSGQICLPDGSCRDMNDDPGDPAPSRYGYASCPAGQTPTGWVGYLAGADFSCTTGAACDQWFPMTRYPNDECGGVNRANCGVNQACCGAGQRVECGNIVWANDILPTDVHYPGYRNCPVGVRVFASNRSNTSYTEEVYCRRGCSCVYPCGSPQRPGTRESCSRQNLGTTYTRITGSCPTTCNSWIDPLDDDDRVRSCDFYRSYGQWESVIECDEDDNCRMRRRWVEHTEYRLTCEKWATICTCDEACTLTAPSNLAFNPATGLLSWSGATSDARSTVRVYISLASEPESTVTGFCTYVVARVIFPKQPPETWRLASRSLH